MKKCMSGLALILCLMLVGCNEKSEEKVIESEQTTIYQTEIQEIDNETQLLNLCCDIYKEIQRKNMANSLILNPIRGEQ